MLEKIRTGAAWFTTRPDFFIKIGKKGEIQTSFFYQGGDLSKTPKVITIIPKIYKVK